MAMEHENNDDMDSLFEGMVLFTPQTVDNNGDDSHSDVQSMRDGDTVALPSDFGQSSQPLDENLFSDLTVINPILVEASEMQIPPKPISVVASNLIKTEKEEVQAGPVLRQSSRKKKRAGLRIGYGRESQHMEDPDSLLNPADSLSIAESSFSSTIPTIQTELVTEGKERQEFVLNSLASQSIENDSSSSTLSQIEEIDGNIKCTVKSHSQEMNKDGDLCKVENMASSLPEARKVYNSQEHEKAEEKAIFDSLDGKYEWIKAQISDKLRHARDQVASISAAKKDSRRRRRQAFENVQLASHRHEEIEKKLEEACEAEDFEMAERLSESLAAAEKEKESVLNAFRDAEAECDAVDSKMQEVLEEQISAEEECVSLLQCFSMDAKSNADSIVNDVEVNASSQTDEWYSLVEAVEAKKFEIEIESQLVSEARLTLNDSIGLLVEDETKEKEVLYERKKSLMQDLEKLQSLVREKEAQIAENDYKIEAVEKKIAEVASSFENVQTGVDAMHDKLQAVLSDIESEREALQRKKDEINNLLSHEINKGERLRNLALASADEANMYQGNLELRKALVTSVLKVREEKLSLVKTEKKVLDDVQDFKQEISVARASLQELASKKSSIQQEYAALKQRMLFIDKRVPELEAEKKVAATARNFKEAARMASEAKSLTAEKEEQQMKMEEFTVELGKIEEDINKTTQKLEELEVLVYSKEKEAAVARFQRLRLTSAAISAERSAALELGDVEDAEILLAELEAADSEAKQLQLVHNISEDEFGSQSYTKHFIPIELVCSLDGKQLQELAEGCN